VFFNREYSLAINAKSEFVDLCETKSPLFIKERAFLQIAGHGDKTSQHLT
jgi:hypothetical protein